MTFRERLDKIDEEHKINAALAGIEKDTKGETAESPPPPYTEEAVPVHCSDCGANTFREEHSAIMCSNCGHGPFCNYCWNRHIREFHPLLVKPYEDARRGIRRRAQFLNHYLIRTVVKPAGFAVALLVLLSGAYYSYMGRGGPAPPETSPAKPTADARGPAASQAPSRVPGQATGEEETQIASSTAPGKAAGEGFEPIGSMSSALSDSVPRDAPVDVSAAAPAEASAQPRARAAGAVPLHIVRLTSPIARSTTASLTIQTAAGAGCTVRVRYRSGPSRAAGLEEKTAGREGRITWSWRIGNKTALGKWPIDIACTAEGAQSQLSAAVTVTD